VWTYTLDDNNAAVQAIPASGTLTDSFTAATIDGTVQVVTMAIRGTNDAAVISGPVSGTVVEAGGIANGTPGTPAATGNLNSTDVDNALDTWNSVLLAAPSANGYGSYRILSNGLWLYRIDNTNPAVEALRPGDTLTDSFTVTTIDGTPQVVTITIEGANDAAVISGTASGSVTEAGGVANGAPGTPTATGDLNSTDVDNPNDTWTAVTSPTASANGYGTFTLTAAGVWTYTLDNSNADVQALNAGHTLADTFTVTTVDGTAQVVTITITGTNDAAVISGDTTGTVVEAGGVGRGIAGVSVATGDLDATDVDNPPDNWNAVSSPTASANGYGIFILTGAGRWIYILDNSNAAVQALGAGDTLTDSFTATTVDGTAQVVTITITGTNDAAVISGDTAGTVLEAGGVGNGTPGIPAATGDLDAADVDTPPGWNPVSTPTPGANGLGTYILTAAGVWTYTLDDSNAAVQALNTGGTLTDTFTATTVDGATQVVTITIYGANDNAIITGDTTGSVVEAGGVANATPGTPTAVGDLNSTDVDNLDDVWTPAAVRGIGGLGTYTLTAAGAWTYTLDNSNAAVQALNVGGTLTDSFTASTVDGTSQLVTITIHGANDAAVISGTVNGSVTEAGGVANGTPGAPTATGNLNSTDVDNPNDTWTVASSPTASTNGYGTFTLTADGVWSYTLDNANPAVQALNVGDTLTDSFTAATVDGTSQLVTITITGSDDAPLAVADIATVAEGGTVTTASVLGNDTDPDNTLTAANITGFTQGANGTVVYNGDGTFTYTHNGSETTSDSFTYTIDDGAGGIATATVAITVTPVNDPPVAVDDAVTVAEGGTVTTASVLGNDTDPDSTLTAANITGFTQGTNGTVVYNGDGTFTYTHNGSETTGDSFTYTIDDGAGGIATAAVQITIASVNNPPVNTVPGAQSVDEDTPLAIAGVSVGDVDTASGLQVNLTVANGVLAVATGGGAFISGNGTGAVALAGTLDEVNAALAGLSYLGNPNFNGSDILTIVSNDGSGGVDTDTIAITVNPVNDAAVISGDTSGTVVEAGGVANGSPGTPFATGDLDAADVDDPADTWTAVSSAAVSINGYGTYTLTAAGIWTYTLDDSIAAVQALNVGDSLTDTFLATTTDGTVQLVTIAIRGTNDAAVITGETTGTVVEAGGVANGTPGTPTATGNLDATDVDNPADAWAAVSSPAASANGFGTYTLTAAGVWTYTLNDDNAAVQALNASDTLTDTFMATTVDGTEQLVTITIQGSNDAAVITGPVTGTLVEAGGVANDTPGTPTATGNLNSADVDNPSDTWDAVATPTPSGNGFGAYTLTSDGIWTYTLDNSNAVVEALNVGNTLTDSFTVTTVDGSAQLVTLTINGTNDAAVITGDTAGTVVEDGGVNNGTPGTPTAIGDLNSTDVDDATDVWATIAPALAGTNGYGTHTLTAAGAWTYTINNSNAAVQALNVGQTLTDTFTATTVDGTSQLVTITIQGSNDAAVITGPVTGTVVEAGGVANGTPGTPTAIGNLNATDVDNPLDTWNAVLLATPSANGYGTYHILSNGVWLYTIDNTNPAVEALNAGDTLTDSFTVTTIDGTPQAVTITIQGGNDAAAITGDTTGDVTEAGGVANGTAGNPLPAVT
jgi:VCBS repeat-containing protein